MTYTISKDFSFSASHRLDGLAEGHQCGRLHGHNYTVRVELTGETLGDTGMLVDYGDLKPFGTFLDEFLDHRHLNGVIDGNPTAERLADYLMAVLVRAIRPVTPDEVYFRVGVSETPKTWAWTDSYTIDPSPVVILAPETDAAPVVETP